MSVEVTRIAVDSLSCVDCDCGACLSAAVAALKAVDGVVYVGIDRRRLMLIVRHDQYRTDRATLRAAVRSCGLSVPASTG